MKRRDFIKGILPTTMTPFFMNGMNIRPVLLSSPIFQSLLNTQGANNDNVLVIVQLNGGNDGLNTVIPINQYAQYLSARPNVAIPQDRILGLNGTSEIGFHPAMTGMRDLFNEGQLSIIQSAGYAVPNFSHFRATDIWMTASDSGQYLKTGWAGRYLDEVYQGFPTGYPNDNMPDPLAIQIGSIPSLLTQGNRMNLAMTITNVNSFYELVNGVEAPAPNNFAGAELTFVRIIARQTQLYTNSIKNAAQAVVQQVTYPDNILAAQLKIVARLIKGGLKTKIYIVSLGGFDTHSLQVSNLDVTLGAHANLLNDLSSSIKAFQNDLFFLGIQDRVLGMTFSEFGRRIKSNQSGGTDHGWAAPMFVFGNKAKAGIIGNTPILPASATVEDNLPYQFDYRTVYASMLQNWLCSGQSVSQTVLNDTNFTTLPVVENGVCNPVPPPPNESVIVEPQPFSDYTAITVKSTGGYVNLRVQTDQGQIVETLIDKTLRAGYHKVMICTTNYAPGTYTVRFENNGLIVTSTITKNSFY
jgi:uncharacterized protein (DUF1501 family)